MNRHIVSLNLRLVVVLHSGALILSISFCATSVKESHLFRRGNVFDLYKGHGYRPSVSTGLLYLKAFTNLERLKLNLTSITDAGLLVLSSLPQLKELEIFGAKTTANGIGKLKRALPQLDVRVTKNF